MRNKIGIASVMAFACVVVFAVGSAQAVVQSSSLLPPGEGPNDSYWSDAAHADYSTPYGSIRFDDLKHFNFTNIVRTPIGADELETFNSTLTAHALLNGGGPRLPATVGIGECPYLQLHERPDGNVCDRDREYESVGHRWRSTRHRPGEPEPRLPGPDHDHRPRRRTVRDRQLL